MENADLLSNIADHLFGLMCHQQTESLLRADGVSIALCHRCFGLHAGLASSILAARLFESMDVRRVDRHAAALLAAFPAVMVLHWLSGYLGWIEPDNTLRLLTGLGAGAALGILAGIYRHSRSGSDGHRTAGSGAIACGILLAVGSGVLLAMIPQPQLLTLIALGAVLWNVATIISMMTALVPSRRLVQSAHSHYTTSR